MPYNFLCFFLSRSLAAFMWGRIQNIQLTVQGLYKGIQDDVYCDSLRAVTGAKGTKYRGLNVDDRWKYFICKWIRIRGFSQIDVFIDGFIEGRKRTGFACQSGFGEALRANERFY